MKFLQMRELPRLRKQVLIIMSKWMLMSTVGIDYIYIVSFGTSVMIMGNNA